MVKDGNYAFSLALLLGLSLPTNQLYAEDNSGSDISLPSIQVNSDVIDALRVHEARKKVPVGLGAAINEDPQLQTHFVKLAEPWVNPDNLPLSDKEKVALKAQQEEKKVATQEAQPVLADGAKNEPLSDEDIQTLIEVAESYKQQIAEAEAGQQLDEALKHVDNDDGVIDVSESNSVVSDDVKSVQEVGQITLAEGDFIGPRIQVALPPKEEVIAKQWINPDDLPIDVTDSTLLGWNGLIQDTSDAEIDVAFVESQQREIVEMVERSVPEVEGNTIQVAAPSQWETPGYEVIVSTPLQINQPAPKVADTNIVVDDRAKKNVVVSSNTLPDVTVTEVAVSPAFIPMPSLKPNAIPERPEVIAARNEEEARKQLKISPLAQKVQEAVDAPFLANTVKGLIQQSVDIAKVGFDQQQPKVVKQEEKPIVAAKQESAEELASKEPASSGVVASKAKDQKTEGKEEVQVAQAMEESIANKDRVAQAIADAVTIEPSKKPRSIRLVTGEVKHSVTFKASDTSLQQSEKTKLTAELKDLFVKGDKQYRIIGYAYDQQKGGYSARRVSLQRAIAIRNFLIKSGVDSSKINVQIVTADDVSSEGELVEIVIR